MKILVALLVAILAYFLAHIFLHELWAGIIAIIVFVAMLKQDTTL